MCAKVTSTLLFTVTFRFVIVVLGICSWGFSMWFFKNLLSFLLSIKAGSKVHISGYIGSSTTSENILDNLTGVAVNFRHVPWQFQTWRVYQNARWQFGKNTICLYFNKSDERLRLLLLVTFLYMWVNIYL